MFNHKQMEYRRLGSTGLKVSALGFGNMVNSHPDRVQIDDSIVSKCLQKGINFFDTAQAYSDGQCQKALGRALKKTNVNRSDIVVSTKIFRIGTNVNTAGNTNRKHVVESVDASLDRLQLDYVDVVFAHLFDEQSPMQEICRGFNKVIQDGKAFYWGTSNWSADNIYEAFAICDRLGLHRPIAEQCQYSMLVRKDMQVEFETLFDRHNYGTTVWSPLAGGFLTGKYFQGIPEGSRMHDPKWMTADLMKKFFYEPYNNPKTIGALKEIQQISKQLGFTLTQTALAWVLRNQNVSTAVIGASKVQQIEDSIGALQLVKKWTPQLEQRINTLLNTTPKPKFNWNQFKAGTPRRAEQPKKQ